LFVFVFLLTRQIAPRIGESKKEYEEERLWRHVTKSLLRMLIKVTVAFSSCQYKIAGSRNAQRRSIKEGETRTVKNAPCGAFQATDRICH